MNDTGLVIFGEVLFDHFPDGSRVLGGAPFNVAWHLQAFGQAPVFISRVGEDDEGSAVRAAMEDWGMATQGLQTDPELPTGRVEVQIVDGEPSYNILQPAAFDAIAAPDVSLDACRHIRLLYHGSLALRNTRSSQALFEIRALRPDTVFVDVNLRAPWWKRRTVLNLADAANWVKLNHHELDWLSPADVGEPAKVAGFIAEHQLDGLLLTHGEKGAELFTPGGLVDSIEPHHGIEPVDTVGAGDAFTAVFILGLAHGWTSSLILSRAQAFASAVCSFRGATTRDSGFYRPFLHDWLMEK
jgi:fructokinase